MSWTEAQYHEYLARRAAPEPKRKATQADRDKLEAKLQAHVFAQADRNGWLIYHTRNSIGSRRGFPDIVAVRASDRGGVVLFSELKREGENPKGRQIIWGELLKRAERVDYRVWRPSDEDEITRYFWQEV